MGNRANVCVKSEWDKPIFFYTHWCGEELPKVIAGSLDRGRERWNDVSYLRRIIFSDMIQGQERDLRGFGISTNILDNEHPILVVDTFSRTVGIAHENTPTRTYKKVSYEEFIANPAVFEDEW